MYICAACVWPLEVHRQTAVKQETDPTSYKLTEQLINLTPRNKKKNQLIKLSRTLCQLTNRFFMVPEDLFKN